MEITPEQFSLIEPSLPVQRGNVRLENLQVINAILYVAEHGFLLFWLIYRLCFL
jgi:hypothetical protein